MVLVVIALVGALVGSLWGSRGAAPTSAGSCAGRAKVVHLARSEYPNIVAHVEASWQAGYPRVLRVNRVDASARRARLLEWWQVRHPQPRGDGLDLDEAPAAALRSSWRADVRPVPAHENRSAGASLGGQLRGVRDGSCVRYDFGG